MNNQTDFSSMLYTQQELNQIRKNITQELIDATNGKKTSFPFLKNPLPKNSLTGEKEIFQVMAIGGSNFEKALMQKVNGELTLLEYHNEPLIILKDKQSLIDLVKEHIDDSINCLALNFSYPMQPVFRDGMLDGKFLRGTKEHLLTGLENQIVGEELEKFLKESLNEDIKVTVANDTVCLALAGKKFDKNINLVAGIVGTGLNFAFFIDNTTAVNLESGNFNKFEQTKSGKFIDQTSNTIGFQFFEKEISGGYLYKHYNIIGKDLNISPIIASKDLDEKAVNGNSIESKLANMLIERSTSLLAAKIAGIYDYKNHIPLTFIVEGSLYWKGYMYKENVEKYLKNFDIPLEKIKIKKVEKSSIFGAGGLTL